MKVLDSKCPTHGCHLVEIQGIPVCHRCFSEEKVKGTGWAPLAPPSLPGGRTDAAPEPTLTGHRLDQKQAAELLIELERWAATELEEVRWAKRYAHENSEWSRYDRLTGEDSALVKLLYRIRITAREAAAATTDTQPSGPSNPEPPVASGGGPPDGRPW